MRTFTYPAVFETGARKGVIVVTFPDVPEAISEGDSDAQAREMGSDALGVALLGLLSVGRQLPPASSPRANQVLLSVDAAIAAKLAVIEAFRDAGLTQAELARRLGKDAREVRRILDPDHHTKIPALTAALAVLGRRLVVSVEAAWHFNGLALGATPRRPRRHDLGPPEAASLRHRRGGCEARRRGAGARPHDAARRQMTRPVRTSSLTPKAHALLIVWSSTTHRASRTLGA